MSRRKTAGFPGEKKIWKSTRILKEISTAIRRSRKREDILKKWSGEERLEISKTNKTSI